jgi:hypothetical protein
MLNRDAIRKLPIGGKITENGITAERTEKDIRISVNAMIDGQRIHRRGFATLAEATSFIEQAKTDARHGRLNLPRGRKLALSFSRAADDYLVRLEETGGKNLVAKRRQLRMYLKPHFGAQRLDGITTFAIERY